MSGDEKRMTRLTIVPITQAEAYAFVDCMHRTHKRPQGYILTTAVANESGRIVGVAIIGRPVSVELARNGWICEVTRTCTDGTPNANSALYGAAWRAVKALGYRKLITYTEEGESGASLRAAGFTLAATLPPRSGWDGPSRPRDTPYRSVKRYRWEIKAERPKWKRRPRSGETAVPWT